MIAIGSTNNTLALSIDGLHTGMITLREGSFTPLQLLPELESQINTALALSGQGISVTLADDNRLVFTSGDFGRSSEVTVRHGTALETLGFVGNESDLDRTWSARSLSTVRPRPRWAVASS